MATSTSLPQILLSVASLVFSGVLVVVTYFYYRETKKHTKEMEATREAEFKPVLKATIEPSMGLHYRFVFKNTGKGAAHDVTARWGFTHLDEDVEWSIPLVTPGQEHEFALPFSSNRISTAGQIESELGGEEGKLHFEWECTDALGNCICNSEEINILETIRKRSGVEFLQKDEQKEIRKELENLTAAAESLPEAIENSRTELEKTAAVINALQRMGTAERQQIRNLTGLPDREVALILSRLKDAGVVDYNIDGDTLWPLSEAADTDVEWKGYHEKQSLIERYLP